MRWFYYAGYLLSTVFLATLSLSAFPKYELEADRRLLYISEQIALSELGVKEDGKNRGEVEKYQIVTNIPLGSSYCAAGIYWSFSMAAIQIGYLCPLPIPKSGVANVFLNYAMQYGNKVEPYPMRNDLIVWGRKKSWKGHIERIIEVLDKKVVKTIAFNVKTDEYEGVAIKKRFLLHPLNRLRIRGLIGFKEVDYEC